MCSYHFIYSFLLCSLFISYLYFLLLIALYEQNAETASFLAFLTLIIGPNAYRKLTALVESEDPKEYVLDEVIGMGISLTGVYIFYSIIGGFEFNINFLTNVDILFILTFIIFRFFDISIYVFFSSPAFVFSISIGVLGSRLEVSASIYVGFAPSA